MSFRSWERPLGILPPGQYELDPTHPINQDGPPEGAWYAVHLPGGPQLVDLSRNGNHGTLQGNVSWVAGRDGPVLAFDGTQGIPYTSPLTTDTTEVTFVIRVRANTSSTRYRPISHNEIDTGYFVVRLNHGSNNNIEWQAADTSTSAVTASTTAFATTERHDIAGTATEGQDINLYVDGSLADTETFPGTFANPLDKNNYIGASRVDTTALDGDIEYALIYTRALPAPDIRTLHADPYALLRPVRRWWAVALDVEGPPPVDISGSIVELTDAAAYEVELTDAAAYKVKLTDAPAYEVELEDALE